MKKCDQIVWLILISTLLLVGCANDASVNNDLSKIPQNSLLFVDHYAAKNARSFNKMEMKAKYLKHYFSPWKQTFSKKVKEKIFNVARKQIKAFTNFPGVGGNAQYHESSWMRQIAYNMNLDAYPNLKMTGIVTRDAILRLLPTMDPSLSNWYQPGQGYPFDNLQISVLSVNTPIYVWHESRDGNWVLISTPYESIGWVQTLDVAYVDAKHMRKWISEKYVVTTLDNQPLFDQELRFYASSRIGQLFPLYMSTKFYYQVLIPLRGLDGYVVPKIVNLRKSKANYWPISVNQKNIAMLVNKLLGKPYGWGELNSYRDCSSTMEALFAPFAIWLPRNSKDQAVEAGQFIDLSEYSDQQKLKMIVSQGIPFLTLLWGSGHIMLYLGVRDGHLYVFHNFWALHTKDFFSDKTGRAIVGRGAITPLNFGSQYLNLEYTFLEHIRGMTVINVD